MVGGPKLTASTQSPRYDGHVRFRSLVSLVVGLLLTLPFLTPASHADSDDLKVHITSISPSVLGKDSVITLKGTASNSGDETWTSVHAYMVMPRWPYTSRTQVHDVLTSDLAYVGERIVNTDRFATIGTLAPGESKDFTIRVPSKELGLSAADGVYPVGVHLVATDPQGHRDPQSQSRDLTLLPRISAESARVPSGLVWPFIDTANPADPDPQQLAESTKDGQMRRYLDAARSTPASARSVLVDPALIDTVEVAAKAAEELGLSEEDIQALTQWTADLIALSQESDTWIIDYSRPDYLGFSASSHASSFNKSIRSSTQDATARHKLIGKKIIWPALNDPTTSLLNSIATLNPDRVLVSTDRVSDWEASDGSLLTFNHDDVRVPLLGMTPLQFSQLEKSTSLFVQHTLSNATLSSIERENDPTADSNALTFINPRWDPEPEQLALLLTKLSSNTSSFLTPTTISTLPARKQAEVSILKETPNKPFGRERLNLTAQLSEMADLVTEVNLNPQTADGPQNDLARSVSLQWRGDNAAAIRSLRASIAAKENFLNGVTLESPATITLSGQQGAFPLTIRNGTKSPVRVSLKVSADVPDISFEDVPAVRIEPGASHTMTLSADMGTQVAATVTAQLRSISGTEFGQSSAFVLRSSNVGQVVWIAMAFAVLLVIAAAVRRTVKRRRASTELTQNGKHEQLTEDEDHG